MDVESRSVADIRRGLNVAHIRPGPPQAPSSSPSPRQKGPPPPPPSAPPRRPGPPELPRRTSKPMERSQEPTAEEDLSSPPPYTPVLPPRSNSGSGPSGPPQLPPRLPDRAPVIAKPKPAPPIKKPSAGGYRNSATIQPDPSHRSLPPLNAPIPVIGATPWSKAKEEKPTFGARRPSYPLKSPVPESPLPPRSPVPSGGSSRPILPPRKSSTNLSAQANASPSLPGRLTPRSSIVSEPKNEEPLSLLPPPRPRPNILALGFGGAKGKLPSPPRTPDPTTRPPPVPTGSRPAVSAPTVNLASKPKFDRAPPVPASQAQNSMSYGNGQPRSACLKCRDFSHVDEHASKFPRHAYNDVRRLALDLTGPFGSATDKARAIFTWLHYNVSYDVDAFFNNRVQPSTPASTLQTGLAVCEGYAGLFSAMAVYAGLEAVVVGGHGKGFGWTEEKTNTVPPYQGNHAWNAVRIDDGNWHLIDSCWGAGNVEPGKYNQVFAPEHFTMTNEEFRKKHFPDQPHQQFCDRTISWEEYYLHEEEGPMTFCHMTKQEYNYGKESVEPRQKVLRPHTQYRFRLAGVCDHTPATTAWILMVHNGQEEVTMMSDGRGGLIADFTTGVSGSELNIRALTEFNKQSAKNMPIDKWKNKRGANSWSYIGICKWEVR
ncbi:hypothetical protein H072_407 [Dactylellina haptotyla CBS 200.50]|uniref:Transglutaminase-like domain-containing protein n=1 Tax=Dactylellina haptotyla (strain CBS 200.50) TaxID=1284197 RepID=S8AX77_DACHA|nr:hypothetical protein H072_407 [Dactylellina haptotyla CBS 200.50]